MNKKLRSDLMLLLTALIWGSSFVAQKSGMDYIGPFAFNGIRTLIGAVVLIPVIYLLNRAVLNKENENTENLVNDTADKDGEKKILIVGGICCGIMLFLAGSIQQIGLFYTSAGKGGFITALYVVLVPILGSLFLHKKVKPVIWICVVAAAIGLYLLCIPSGDFSFATLNIGDVLVFICAFGFAVHILVIDYFSPKVDGVKLSCIQFFVAGLISVPFMFTVDPVLGFDLPDLGLLLDCWMPLIYSGVLSCGVAYTLQVVAQADADPAVASLILCLESVFAVIAGMILLGESMAVREIVGCVIMFASIIVATMMAGDNEPKLKTEE